ncbi:MAG: phytanoyl-CoA dioxygenase family protein [Candidatus Poribacteria bacterium]|nr:phytanoyl-CoA dioxygenase family protein [Candidatus Poribacteria bacterium]
METVLIEGQTSVLTDKQKRQWKEDGYLVLKDALSSEEIKNLTAVVDQMYEEHLKQPDVKPNTGLDRRNVMKENDIFVELMDHPVTFPVVLELMGPYIGLSMSEVVIRPTDPEGKGMLHTDGGQAMGQMRMAESSIPLQIKLQYFLTDLPAPDMGNFTLVPGSHNRPFPEGGFKEGPYIPEALQLCVNAGDVAIFPHPMWHGFVANRSDTPRKTLIYCYVQQCMRAFDYEKASPELLARCTPRQQRLIGDIGEWKYGSYFYSPPDQAELITGITV